MNKAERNLLEKVANRPRWQGYLIYCGIAAEKLLDAGYIEMLDPFLYNTYAYCIATQKGLDALKGEK
jgi:hypothetical protein